MVKQISVIGAPIYQGQSHPGVEMGPKAIRCAGVIEKLEKLNYIVHDLGDIVVVDPKNSEKNQNDLRNLQQVVDANEQLALQVDKVIQRGEFPLILGGDHSVALGTLAGVAKHYKKLGVIWYDAHGDLNNEKTSPTGNIHGMSLAASLGIGHNRLTHIYGYKNKVKAENIVIIGARSLDDQEKELIREKGIKTYTMYDIDRLGMAKVIIETIDYLKKRQTDGIHLSFDLDGLDPGEAPGVGTPALGGITYRESRLAMEMFASKGVITSAEFVEINPILDVEDKTSIITVALIGSLFGEKLI